MPESRAGIAIVLRELAGEIDSLGAVLCADAELSGRFVPQLQAIDMIAQVQVALAELLDADCAACAATELRIGALRARLEDCLPHANCHHAIH